MKDLFLDTVDVACIDKVNKLVGKSLPSKEQMKQILPESFVFVKPGNSLIGDSCWMKKIKNKVFVSSLDFTGQGVPRALISIVGLKLLSKFINECWFLNPAEILNQLNEEFTAVNKRITDIAQKIKNEIDIALCTIDKSTMTMEYAGAYNPIYLIRKGKLIELVADKIPIPIFTNNGEKKLSSYRMKIKKGDTVYLFTEGYPYRFKSSKEKIIRYKYFQELILSIHLLTLPEQKEFFGKMIEEWKSISGEEQTDDIFVFGFKV